MKNIFKQLLKSSLRVCLLALLLAACSPAVPAPLPTAMPSATSGPKTVSREAQVQRVEVQASPADPPGIAVVVHGDLVESCATLGGSQVQYASSTFQIMVYVNSPADIGCAQITTPFETTVPLDTKDLPAGSYTVIVNGVSAVFTLPVETAVPSPLPTTASDPAPTPAPGSLPCTDSAQFVADITIPDNMVIAPNTAFTKTWRLKNTGTCTWDNKYLVAYISGTTMSQQPGYWVVPQGQTVAPGQTVDISVGMTSPVENGYYGSYWGLKKQNGTLMPVQGGANGNSFYVKLKVDDGTVDGNVTAASIAIEREEGSGAACTAEATYFVSASVTADGPATASYEINSTAGQIPAGYFQTSPTGPVSVAVTGTLPFDRAATKMIALRFAGPYPYPDDITVNLRVNDGDWHSAKLSCQ